jgi:hypothetical protein
MALVAGLAVRIRIGAGAGRDGVGGRSTGRRSPHRRGDSGGAARPSGQGQEQGLGGWEEEALGDRA